MYPRRMHLARVRARVRVRATARARARVRATARARVRLRLRVRGRVIRATSTHFLRGVSGGRLPLMEGASYAV